MSFGLRLEVSGSVEKTAIFLSRRSFKKKHFSEKNPFLKILSDFEQNFAHHLEQKFRHGFQNCILRVQRNSLRNYKTFEKIVFFFKKIFRF